MRTTQLLWSFAAELEFEFKFEFKHVMHKKNNIVCATWNAVQCFALKWKILLNRAEIYTSVKGNKVAVPIEAIIYKELSDDEPEVATEQDSNSISISAADSSSSNTYVFIMVNGEAVKRDVELGISNDQLQEIIAGLDAGDQVITGPARVLAKLDQGSAVQEIEKKDQ